MFGTVFKSDIVVVLIEKGYVFPEQSKQGETVIQIQQSEATGETYRQNVEIYVVKSQGRYFSLLAETDDIQLADAMTKLKLGESNVSLVVRKVSTSTAYLSIKDGLNGEQIARYEKDYALDRAAITQNIRRGYYVVYAALAAGALLIGIALVMMWRIRRRYNALCMRFPELRTSKTFLSESAHYYDDEAKWYIYNDYFIITNGCVYYDLNRVLWLYTVNQKRNVYDTPIIIYGRLFDDYFKGHEFRSAMIGKHSAEHYAALLDYIGRHYGILIGPDEAARYNDLKRGRY